MSYKLHFIRDYFIIPLPAIVRWNDPEAPNPSARGIRITMPVGYNKDSPSFYHEQFHVVQFYVLLFVVTVLSLLPFFVAKAAILWVPSVSQPAHICALILSVLVSFATTKWYGSGEASLSRECAAYGESLRRSPAKDINWLLDFYTEALATGPLYRDIQAAMGGTANERRKIIKAKIEKAFIKRDLFA